MRLVISKNGLQSC